MKAKATTIFIIALMSTALLLMAYSPVMAQNPFGFQIIQVTQYEGASAITSGTVEEAVTVIATLNTYDGPYKVWFGDKLVDNNTASGYYVASNFTIPEGPAGDYTITLLDATINQNTTTVFSVGITYAAKAVVPAAPAQLQEGDNIVLNVTITGGLPSTAYVANITVVLPTSLPSSLPGGFSQIVPLTSSTLGTAIAQISFPDASFDPSGSTTIYTGSYIVYFNASEGLAQSNFFIGFTDQSIYHRQDTVRIRAVGYQPNQAATLDFEYLNSSISSQSVTADGQGVITATWAVPSSAKLGEYTANITTQSNAKAIPDVQVFNIPGYASSFRALNLANEMVPDLLIEAVDQATGVAYNSTTDIYGFAFINLEKGNNLVTAYWNGVQVGQMQVSVSGNSTHDVTCNLTDLRVTVQAVQGNQKVAIPFVNININYTYVETKTGETKNGTVSRQTDLNGKCSLNSTLPGIDYTVNAYKYGAVFNTGNNTVSHLPAQPTFEVTVLCPDETLTLKTVDYNLATLPNVRIILIEQESGIFYSANAGSSGSVTVDVVFGQYRVQVYTADNILVNETVIRVVSNTDNRIRCAYNLQLLVKVVDYFGNPISNVNVQVSRSGMNPQSKTTQGDGTVAFDNIIGGNVEITAYPAGNENSFVATNLQLDSSTTVQLKMGSYVVLGGMLIGASLLAAIIIILVAALVVVGVELFRMLRKRSADKSEK